MRLSPGTRLGPYEIFAPLGSGGMGEVYRARDTRLGRDVAVKVLPQQLSANAGVRARFEREARTVSSFNHPHICTLHDVGREGDTDYLVMELVDGETLADRLTRGRLPTADVLRIGAQVADALELAHRAGVTHRDLKPGNIMLTKTGAKLMDFGLARSALDGVVHPVSVTVATLALSQSPHLASPLTAEGTIVGTFQYLAPEQLEGNEADARSDLWALGCVLYEMATGQRAFEGKSQASLIASIMNTDPPRISERVPMTPPALDRVVQQCLAKDPDDRWQSAGDLRRELQWIAQSSSLANAASSSPRVVRHAAWILPTTALVALAAGLFIGERLLPGGRGASSGARSGPHVVSVNKLTDYHGQEVSPQLSPDGKMLLFVSRSGADEDIYLLRVGGENPINLTANSRHADYDPVYSPDGERIAFSSTREGGGVFVMGATGESPRKLTSEGSHPSWSPDGRKIVYSTERVVSPYGRGATANLWVVDVASGEKKRIYTGDAVDPAWSPSGHRIAFWSAEAGQRDLKTIRPDGGDLKPVTRDLAADWGPFWAPDGRSIYFISDRSGIPDLWRVAIDEAGGTVRGAPEPVTAGVARVMRGSFSADGKRLAIMVNDARSEVLQGGFDPIIGKPTSQPVQVFGTSTPIVQADLSDDGSWIAYRTGSPGENITIMRRDGTERRRLTDDGFRNRGPSWVRGTGWIMFYSNRDGKYATWLVRSDGTELRKIAGDSRYETIEVDMTKDGSRLAVAQSGSGGLELGIAQVRDDWFTAGKLPTPAVIDSVYDGFTPLAWSPDGTRIMGDLVLPQGRCPAIFTLATRHAEALSAQPTSIQTWSWLPDSHRIIGWDVNRNSAVLWDVVTKTSREIPGIPGPGDLRLSADGRTLIVVRQINESDIWLLTFE
ncbi:MAG TPA: protein kinase [Candidatus Eisenbacteria bacterium]|nr:protein kinase [Candidatus Eisenbacteria bacterium]